MKFEIGDRFDTQRVFLAKSSFGQANDFFLEFVQAGRHNGHPPMFYKISQIFV
jgi:hypothetical protein